MATTRVLSGLTRGKSIVVFYGSAALGNKLLGTQLSRDMRGLIVGAERSCLPLVSYTRVRTDRRALGE